MISQDGTLPAIDTGYRFTPTVEIDDTRMTRTTYYDWAADMRSQGRLLPSESAVPVFRPVPFNHEYRSPDPTLPLHEEKRNVNDGELLTFSGNWKDVLPRDTAISSTESTAA